MEKNYWRRNFKFRRVYEDEEGIFSEAVGKASEFLTDTELFLEQNIKVIEGEKKETLPLSYVQAVAKKRKNVFRKTRKPINIEIF